MEWKVCIWNHIIALLVTHIPIFFSSFGHCGRGGKGVTLTALRVELDFMQTPVCSFATKPLGHFFCYWANVYGLFCLSWGEGHGVYGLFNRTIACVKISTGHVIKFSKAQFFKKARGPMAPFFFCFSLIWNTRWPKKNLERFIFFELHSRNDFKAI